MRTSVLKGSAQALRACGLGTRCYKRMINWVNVGERPPRWGWGAKENWHLLNATRPPGRWHLQLNGTTHLTWEQLQTASEINANLPESGGGKGSRQVKLNRQRDEVPVWTPIFLLQTNTTKDNDTRRHPTANARTNSGTRTKTPK